MTDLDGMVRHPEFHRWIALAFRAAVHLDLMRRYRASQVDPSVESVPVSQSRLASRVAMIALRSAWLTVATDRCAVCCRAQESNLWSCPRPRTTRCDLFAHIWGSFGGALASSRLLRDLKILRSFEMGVIAPDVSTETNRGAAGTLGWGIHAGKSRRGPHSN